jgi:hypothetical protein
MTSKEWLADLGGAADELGYGILRIEKGRVILVGQQDEVEITVESVLISGALLRKRLAPIPYRSGAGYNRAYEESRR